MIILVSNDDGVYSDGIQALAEKLKKLAKIVVVAPDREQSASSHSITLHRPLRISTIKKDVYGVSGTPTDCISLGVNEILKKSPDLIVSGINKGANLGNDVHYSGTVSAAMEGAIMGVPSIAVSLVTREDKVSYDFSATFAAGLSKQVLKKGLPPGIMLNVNIPNLPKNRIKGYQYCTMGRRNYGDIIVEKIDPRGRKYYWIGGDEAGFEDIKGSDCNAILSRYISITPLTVNITDYPFLEEIRNWKV